jgi:primosomal protein N' (replication factor Y)
MKNTSKPSSKLILHRYHARDAAVVLASFIAKVLLGSATPSIETYFNGKSGKYGLVEIKEYGNVMMPDIKLVDLKINISEKK